jgi:TonB family protein
VAPRVDRRSLAYAIATSLALHGLLLAWRWEATDGGTRAARPIVARLAPAEETSSPHVIASAPATSKPARRSMPSGLAREEPVPLPSAQETLDEATSLARYRYQLIGAALPHKRYPQEAIDAGWEGDVLVRVTIRASGAADVSVKASSGQPTLDEQALAAFRAAAPLVPLPVALRGQEFAIEVRAVYSLRD